VSTRCSKNLKKITDCISGKNPGSQKEFDYYEPQEPAKMNFKGNSYLLINGLCLSSVLILRQ
jgi:hypothetical protein